MHTSLALLTALLIALAACADQPTPVATRMATPPPTNTQPPPTSAPIPDGAAVTPSQTEQHPATIADLELIAAEIACLDEPALSAPVPHPATETTGPPLPPGAADCLSDANLVTALVIHSLPTQPVSDETNTCLTTGPTSFFLRRTIADSEHAGDTMPSLGDTVFLQMGLSLALIQCLPLSDISLLNTTPDDLATITCLAGTHNAEKVAQHLQNEDRSFPELLADIDADCPGFTTQNPTFIPKP